MTKEEGWHRRHAIQIACQLPEKTEDSLIILRLAMILVRGFLSEVEDKPAKASATVLRIVPDPSGGAA
jgi:hypothetical protein